MAAKKSPVPFALFWESEIVKGPNGEVTVRALQPISHMSIKQAATALGCSAWTVGNLFKLGLLEGFKPGARMTRKDGRASNAALKLSAESVLKYKQRQEEAARQWQREQ